MITTVIICVTIIVAITIICGFIYKAFCYNQDVIEFCNDLNNNIQKSIDHIKKYICDEDVDNDDLNKALDTLNNINEILYGE